MKFAVIGTTEFSISCAKALLDSGAEMMLISKPEHGRPSNSADISGFARGPSIPYCEVEDINAPESAAMLRKNKPDYILSSWPMIIKKEVLQIPRACIGTHPTELPHNRGRHPLHWLIILGIHESKLSFFSMDEGIDSGKLLLQVPFTIGKGDYINDAVLKVNKAAYEGTKMLHEQLKKSQMEGTEQEHKKANYWRKRTPHDVILDLRMPSDTILRIVRSFSTPYPCAKLIFGNRIIKVAKAAIAKTGMPAEEVQRAEPGRIISVKGRKITAKCDDRIIELESTEPLPEEIAEAEYIHPPTKYLTGWGREKLKGLEK